METILKASLELYVSVLFLQRKTHLLSVIAQNATSDEI